MLVFTHTACCHSQMENTRWALGCSKQQGGEQEYHTHLLLRGFLNKHHCTEGPDPQLTLAAVQDWHGYCPVFKLVVTFILCK